MERRSQVSFSFPQIACKCYVTQQSLCVRVGVIVKLIIRVKIKIHYTVINYDTFFLVRWYCTVYVHCMYMQREYRGVQDGTSLCFPFEGQASLGIDLLLSSCVHRVNLIYYHTYTPSTFFPRTPPSSVDTYGFIIIIGKLCITFAMQSSYRKALFAITIDKIQNNKWKDFLFSGSSSKNLYA
jgi:hypothetical protein